MISHRLRCAYVHVPKTGGHSIDRFFIDRGLVSVGRWHATATELRRKIDPGKGYFLFATVRNPWDRFLSEYMWQASAFPSQIPTPWGNKAITFADYCRSDFAWYPDTEIRNGHLSDQAGFVFDDGDHSIVDLVVRFERLQEGFAEVCQRLGLSKTTLPHLNRTEHVPYWHYYTDELIELVAKRYERDIRLLGYTFGS
jgi:hypothetical protein